MKPSATEAGSSRSITVWKSISPCGAVGKPSGPLPIGSVKPLVDLSKLVITTEIDGKVVEERSLADLVRDPVQLLVDVTEFMTLSQGDVLLVGVSYQAPQAKPGSQVKISADGVGSLQFSIAGAQA